jgi:hypothetical protein
MKTILRLSIVVAFFVLLNGEPPRQAQAEVVQPVTVNNTQVEKVADTTSFAPTVTPEPPKPKPTLVGDKYDWLRSAGVPENQLVSAVALIQRESSWRFTATNHLGCIGLGQACPSGIKPVLLAKCPNWQTDPVCQLKVFTDYVKARYGGWVQAKAFSDRNNWY